MKALFSSLIAASLLPASAATVYSIDINDANSPVTASGWTGLDTVNTGNGGSVTIGSIDFSIGSSDGARLRGTVGSPNPNALTGDLAFYDGAGQAIILFIGGAGDLLAGDWQVEVWMHDATSPLGDSIVGYRTGGAETIINNNVAANATDAAISFTLTSDGASAYDIFVRENNAENRSRLNAVRLTSVPEPSTGLLGLLGALALLRRRR